MGLVGPVVAYASLCGTAGMLRGVTGASASAKRIERSAETLDEELSDRETAEGEAAEALVYCCTDGTGVLVLPSEQSGTGRDGSGTVEGMCKASSENASKRRGRRWSVASANAVLALCAAICNDRHDDFCQQGPALASAA